MNDSINCSGFVGMLADTYDTYDYYGNSLSDIDTETAKSSIQFNTSLMDDSDYGWSSNE